ncbi:hypothetical protein SBI_09628 [Streptomyces bingchenggensis BCW-1]|uniref:Uncharacterized protein n=1 Tax=Streptomyces bingchenggensis (strain BCW-1) TaxID=749414 RepID=D7C9N4_STRBB|nr:MULTISPECIES: hypothetical protein [Streptomyces]ADI12746.1 hypothetical protein SBI_09628 [Streptomyces bingchenggensis BCW-1]
MPWTPGHHEPGGQLLHHPREHTTYQVRPLPGAAGHPIVGGLTPFLVTSEQYHLHMDPATT